MLGQYRDKIRRLRVQFSTTARTPRSRIAAVVLEAEWAWPRNLLFFLLTVLATAIVCSAALALPEPLESTRHFLTGVLFLALFLEMFSIVLSLAHVLLSHISLSGMDHADHLFSFLNQEQRRDCLRRFSDGCKNTPGGNVDSTRHNSDVEDCIDQVLSNFTLATHALDRFGAFVGVWLRLWATFTVVAVGLVFIQRLAQKPHAVFGTSCYDVKTLRGFCSLIEQSLYHNLVTISTVGYGDFAPVTVAGRFMVVCEILTTLTVLTLGLNILVGIIFEGSALAWFGRRDLVFEFLRRATKERGGVP